MKKRYTEYKSKSLHNDAIKFNTTEFMYEIEITAENLSIPWAIDISDDGKIYFTERNGNIRIIENGILIQQPLITLRTPFISRGEGGLLGLVLDPDFTQNRYIYIMHTYVESNYIYNRILRLIEINNKAQISSIIYDKIPGSLFHNGGRIKVGPDRKLYITTGDAEDPSSAQNITSSAGKILRIDLNGRIPEDNPFVNSPVYSLGLRNPQGITWSSNHILYATDHGQTGHDEINIIYPGSNYGWPLVQGYEDSDEIIVQKPLLYSGDDTWAPSGIAYINKGPWHGKLLVANLRGNQLISITLNEKGTEVLKTEFILQSMFGRLREVIQAKDGSVYLTTSNMDGRGNPDKSDDKIIHLIPKTRIL